mgnify:CR=1 FL=1
MIELLVSIILLLGTALVLIAALGLMRMPDLYIRMHASTKAGTVGLGLILLAVAVYYPDVTVLSRVLGTLFFIFLTAPVAAHVIGKAMLDAGYPYFRGEKAGSVRSGESARADEES